jgi:hypothetical protein
MATGFASRVALLMLLKFLWLVARAASALPSVLDPEERFVEMKHVSSAAKMT